jgi:hypothetical protein
MTEYKTRFNYLLTHKAIPTIFFATLELGYNFLEDPELLQKFLQMAAREAAHVAKDNPDIEPPYQIEKFEMYITGDFETNGVIGVKIPNCDKTLDCFAIAIPTALEKKRYFTCELSENPLTNEPYFTLGEWTPDQTHHNHGKIELTASATFIDQVQELAYGPQEGQKNNQGGI